METLKHTTGSRRCVLLGLMGTKPSSPQRGAALQPGARQEHRERHGANRDGAFLRTTELSTSEHNQPHNSLLTVVQGMKREKTTAEGKGRPAGWRTDQHWTGAGMADWWGEVPTPVRKHDRVRGGGTATELFFILSVLWTQDFMHLSK